VGEGFFEPRVTNWHGWPGGATREAAVAAGSDFWRRSMDASKREQLPGVRGAVRSLPPNFNLAGGHGGATGREGARGGPIEHQVIWNQWGGDIENIFASSVTVMGPFFLCRSWTHWAACPWPGAGGLSAERWPRCRWRNEKGKLGADGMPDDARAFVGTDPAGGAPEYLFPSGAFSGRRFPGRYFWADILATT